MTRRGDRLALWGHPGTGQAHQRRCQHPIRCGLRGQSRVVGVGDEHKHHQLGQLCKPRLPQAVFYRLELDLAAVLGLLVVLLSDGLKVIAESNLGYR